MPAILTAWSTRPERTYQRTPVDGRDGGFLRVSLRPAKVDTGHSPYGEPGPKAICPAWSGQAQGSGRDRRRYLPLSKDSWLGQRDTGKPTVRTGLVASKVLAIDEKTRNLTDSARKQFERKLVKLVEFGELTLDNAKYEIRLSSKMEKILAKPMDKIRPTKKSI